MYLMDKHVKTGKNNMKYLCRLFLYILLMFIIIGTTGALAEIDTEFIETETDVASSITVNAEGEVMGASDTSEAIASGYADGEESSVISIAKTDPNSAYAESLSKAMAEDGNTATAIAEAWANFLDISTAYAYSTATAAAGIGETVWAVAYAEAYASATESYAHAEAHAGENANNYNGGGTDDGNGGGNEDNSGDSGDSNTGTGNGDGGSGSGGDNTGGGSDNGNGGSNNGGNNGGTGNSGGGVNNGNNNGNGNNDISNNGNNGGSGNNGGRYIIYRAPRPGAMFGFLFGRSDIERYCRFKLQLNDNQTENDARAKYYLNVITWDGYGLTEQQFEQKYNITGELCIQYKKGSGSSGVNQTEQGQTLNNTTNNTTG